MGRTALISDGSFDSLLGQQVLELAYGENRDQSPAFLHSAGTEDPLGWDKFTVVAGDPSYISLADGDRTLQIMCLLADAFRINVLNDRPVPHIAIACKHGNPCGAAVSWNNPIRAVRKAMFGDPLAVMGSEVMTNFVVTEDIGQAIYRVPDDLVERVGRNFWGPDVVFAPGFDDAAVELLGKHERRRLLANPALATPTILKDEWMLRPVRGGFLRQQAPWFVLNLNVVNWNTESGLYGRKCLSTLLLAWAVAWRANSNTVILAKDQMLIGPGVGQQDRVACVQLALDRARRSGHDTRGAVFASDAFFPYARRASDDAPLEGSELLAEAGCIGGVVPADGKNIEEVRSFFRERGMSVVFVPKEHRGFSQH